jgi:RimJ/RimL family protein N-acetyltransferase
VCVRNGGGGAWASALIKEAVVWAQSHELHKLYAEVFPENEAALAFLEKHGFH